MEIGCRFAFILTPAHISLGEGGPPEAVPRGGPPDPLGTALFDSHCIFQVGIPVVGFSPINNTPVLLHANDEYLNTATFLKGIQVYLHIIPAVANL